jgi:hypothetical protein
MTDPRLHEFATPGPVSASMRIGAGVIVVYALETAVTSVAVHPYDESEASRLAAQSTKVNLTGDRLHIDVPDAGTGWLFRRSVRIRLELRVPLDSQIRVQVGSADIHADGRLRLLEVKSGSGDVNVSDSGDLWIQTGSGDVRAERVRGRLRVQTGSGDVSVGRLDGPASFQSASGDVSINAVHNDLQATSASGDITVHAAHRGQVRITSASGDVYLGVPVGTKVWFDIGTMSGTTTSDLSVSPQSPAGGASLNLQVQTMSGDVTVSRVTAAGDPDEAWPGADWASVNLAKAAPAGPARDETASTVTTPDEMTADETTSAEEAPADATSNGA